jgi:transcriptional regulator with XRE-family HTH domain
MVDQKFPPSVFSTANLKAIDHALGAAIAGRREEMGMTQSRIARAAGYSPQQYAKYESGESALSVGRFLQLCGVLQLAPEALLARASTTALPLPGVAPRVDRRSVVALTHAYEAMEPSVRRALLRLARAVVK